MRQKQFVQGLLGAFIGGAMMIGCSSEDVDMAQDTQNESGIDFLTRPNEQNVKFNIEYNVTEGYVVKFDVYAENPYDITAEGFRLKEDAKPIISGMTGSNGKYNVARIIPGGVKEVYVASSNVGVPALLHGSIESGNVTPIEVELQSLTDVEEAPESRANLDVAYLGTWNSWGRPNYIDPNVSCEISNKELRTITAALPEWKAINEDYCLTKGIYVAEEAEIWISLVSAKSLFNCALGYYCYKEGMSKEDVEEVIALPRANLAWFSSNGLKSGQYVKLKYLNPETKVLEDKFPKGAYIGWVLHRSGYNCLFGTVNNGTYQFYSNKEWNPESGNKEHTALFQTNSGHVILGYEDMNNDFILADNDCNDLVFHIKSAPENAISASVKVPDAEEDSIEEEVDVVQPLESIIDVPEDDFWKDLVVASQSALDVTDNNVTGVKDVLYVANTATMSDMVSQTTTTDEKTKKVVVRTTVKLTRTTDSSSSSSSSSDSKKGRTVVRTTVKLLAYDADATSRATVTEYESVDELIKATVEEHRAEIENGAYIKIEIVMEFEGVEYQQFVESINLPPYSPFIEHTEE